MKYEVSWTEDGKKKSVEKHSYRQAEILACTKPDAEIKSVRGSNSQPVN